MNASITIASQLASGLARDERASLGMAHVQPRGPPQAEMLAGEREHRGIHLADLVVPAGILGRERSRERAGAAADVQHPPSSRGSAATIRIHRM